LQSLFYLFLSESSEPITMYSQRPMLSLALSY
jgi:hypothetical protein